MCYRGMEFGGAHVWKMSHPQAMQFFHTQNLGPGTLELCTQHFPKGGVPTPKLGLFYNFFA